MYASLPFFLSLISEECSQPEQKKLFANFMIVVSQLWEANWDVMALFTCLAPFEFLIFYLRSSSYLNIFVGKTLLRAENDILTKLGNPDLYRPL